ncbi:MAG TPA: glycosyltransferase family 2 protein [Novosphingobium sp.]|nr:glycosyltransferase family 2 protein [Novosphingobium sp.]
MNKSNPSPTIEVLLATYLGAQFLEAQLESLLAQDRRDFTVLASDGGSDDATSAILQRYAATHPGFLRLLPSAASRLGPSENFARLLDSTSADYVFFCDQDDIWLPGKVSASLALMFETERQYGADTPVLVHTDLCVVDQELHELGASFMAYVGIDPARNRFGALLLGNVVTGCTALANRALYELARPIPAEALMFDHWLAQVATGLGRIAYLATPTVLYRQHIGNAIGARRSGTASFLMRVRRTLWSDTILRVLARYSVHAEVLDRRYRHCLAPQHAIQARALAAVWDRPRHLRFRSLVQAGLVKPTLSTNVGLFVLLLRDGASLRHVRP